MKHYMKSLATPVGEMSLVATKEAVVAFLWDREDLARLGVDDWMEGPSCPMLARAERQLREYFAGEREGFDLPFELRGTEFQRRVWGELVKIPFGKTISYRELARRVDNPGAMRAVGSANGRNPACILVPCHRVVRSSGEIGGYGGGLPAKRFLLDLEIKSRT